MRTPSHWKDMNLLSFILSPLGLIYGLATALRIKLIKPQKCPSKVICIGNLTAGGTGKTPIAVSIAQLLQHADKIPYFITRGYGGKLQNIQVDKNKHSAQDVGDEPLLLARQAPVIVNHKRFEAAKKACSLGADFIIMDDGFQNPYLYKDISLLVIDGQFGLGNGLCIPAGPMREFFSQGIKRVSAVAIIGEDKYHIAEKFKNIPVFYGHISPQKQDIKNKSVIAFAGIGRPSKFYQSLKECGFEIVQSFDFPDHHFYNREELLKLKAVAKEQNAVLYTTAKDFVKIPSDMQEGIHVLEISIEWEKPQDILNFLLSQSSSHKSSLP